MQAQDPVKTPCGMTRQPKAVHQGLTIEQLTLYTQAILHEHALRPTSVKQGHVRQPHDTTLFVPLIQYTISPGQRFWLTEAYLDTATPQLPQKPALFSTAAATLPVESEEDFAIALTRYLGLYDDAAQDIIDRRDCVLDFLDRNAIHPSRVLDDTRAEGARAQQYSIDLPGQTRPRDTTVSCSGLRSFFTIFETVCFFVINISSFCIHPVHAWKQGRDMGYISYKNRFRSTGFEVSSGTLNELLFLPPVL